MNFFFLCIILFGSLACRAGQTVILTSLTLSQKDKLKIEQIFMRDFAGSVILIRHEVGPAELHQLINSPHTEKLFWISHSADNRAISLGVSASEVIMDIHGNDVKKFFSSVGPNLKYLAIIGCQAQGIIDGFRERQNYDDRPDLKIFSFKKKIDLFRGVEMAIANDRSFKPNQGFSSLVPSNNIEFDIQATKSPAESWVELGDRVLGVLGGKRARFKATFPVALWDTMHSANIRYVRSKADSSDRFKEISIQANGFEGYWKLFTTEDGNIIGSKDRMLFVY